MLHLAESTYHQAPSQRLRGEACPVLDPVQTLLFEGGHQLSIDQQCRRGVAVKGVQSKDVHRLSDVFIEMIGPSFGVQKRAERGACPRLFDTAQGGRELVERRTAQRRARRKALVTADASTRRWAPVRGHPRGTDVSSTAQPGVRNGLPLSP